MKMGHRASSAKQIISAFMLLALLVLASFSFTAMTHASDGLMQSDCPFTAMGTPLCPQDLMAAAIHHIFAYQSLLNVPAVISMTVLLIATLLLAYRVFLFFIRPPAFQSQLIGRSLDSPPVFSRDRKITRRLSLFEHSPSFV